VYAKLGTQVHRVISVQLIMYGMETHVSRVQLVVLLRLDRPQDRLDHVHAQLTGQGHHVSIVRLIIHGLLRG
jgi:hypothetical protein